MFNDGFDKLDDELKSEEELRLENQKVSLKKTKLNEYGDKISRPEICQGALLFLFSIGIVACTCIRGWQEIKKHQNKVIEKAKVVQIQER